METGGCDALTVVWDTSHDGGGERVGSRTRQSCFQPENHVHEFIRFARRLKNCAGRRQIRCEGDVARVVPEGLVLQAIM